MAYGLPPRPGPAPLWRESLIAAAVLAGFLLLAVFSSYARGPGLLRQVIWDPVTLYSIYPGDRLASAGLREGFFPLWDPGRGLGSPHVLPVGVCFDYPLRLFAYAWDSDLGWEMYFLLRFLLAGMACFLSARAVPVGFRGSLLAGVAYMLCGYFREYQNSVSMEVEAAYPLMLFFVGRLIRRPTLGAFVGAVVVGHWTFSNPESSVYAYSAALLYAAAGAWLGAPARWGWRRRLGYLAVVPAGIYLGTMALRAAGYLQFVDAYHRGWTFHFKGMGSLHFPLANAIAMATPAFDYWLPSATGLEFQNLEQLNLVPAYLGLVVFVLAAAALLQPARLPRRGLFFAALAVVLAGMVFAAPPFSLILKLPIARYFQNFRYAQPYLAHAVALLAGMGLELALCDRRARRIAAAVGGAVAIWLLWHVGVFRREWLALPAARWGGLAAGAIAAAAVAASAIAARRKPDRKQAVLAATLIAAAGLELALYFNLAVPLFGPNAFSIDRPPVVDFIHARERGADPFRIVGLDPETLHPNLAGMFGLEDLRDHTPLAEAASARFMAAANRYASEPEMIAGFLAGGKFYFEPDLSRWPPRLLDLLGVRYVLARRPPGAWPAVSITAPAGVVASGPGQVAAIEAVLQNVRRDAVLVHAPARAAYRLIPDADGGPVGFEAGLMDHAAECRDADGVELIAMAEGGPKPRLVFFRRFLAGRGRGWRPVSFPTELPATTLALASLPGPRGDVRCDFGVFSEPLALGRSARLLTAQALEPVYDREVRGYLNRDVLPRGFAPTRLESAPTVAGMIEALFASDPAQTAWAPPADGLEPRVFAPASITRIEEGRASMSFEARSEGEALAVISSLYYPGWRAWVNGREVRLHRVNGIMKAVVLPPGSSRVILKYEPLNFRMGAWAHVAGLVGVVILIKVKSKKAKGKS